MNKFLFDEDIFLETEYPIAEDSADRNNWEMSGSSHDFTDGKRFAAQLRSVFPQARSLIDLGTATGMVPMTMRDVGLMAVGLEGSDNPQEQGLGAWSAMPQIVRTCDISRPFRIVDAEGHPVVFDFVTSWDVLEHIPATRIGQSLRNMADLMGKESVATIIINYACSGATHGLHMLWGEEWGNPLDYVAKERYLADLLSESFNVDDSLKDTRRWNYCRPTPTEIDMCSDNGLDPMDGRTVWWLRKK